MKNKIIFFALVLGLFFFISNAHADLYLNSKVGSIYFNTSGVARASIGPGGNFSINTSDFFVNTNLGRVGIGTVNPLNKLEVSGGKTSGNLMGNIASIDSTSVGLGVGGALVLYGIYSGTIPTIGAGIDAYKETATSGEYDFALRFHTRTDALGGSAVTERMRITSGGNVGIGTSTPSNKLDVRGVINASSDIYFNNGTKVGLGNLSGGGTAGYLAQWKDGVTLNNSNIFQGSGGQIGINISTPIYTLHVKGGAFVDTLTNTLPFIVARNYKSSQWEEIRIGVDDSIGTFHYMNDEAANRIIFRMNNTDLESGAGASANVNDVLTIAGDLAGGKVGVRNSNPLYSLDVVGNLSTSLGAFLATSSGNVGIGTTGPTQKLDVRGSINASGDIYFNNGTKVGLGNLSGGGTSGYIPQWSGSATLNNSMIYQNGSNIGVGTTNPGYTLDVVGDIYASGNLMLDTTRTTVGSGAGANSDGDSVVQVGYQAGVNNVGHHQTVLGSGAGTSNSASYQTAVGYGAGEQNGGLHQVALGYLAGAGNSGSRVIGIGTNATVGNTGSDVVAIGDNAGMSNTASNQFILKQANINSVPLIQGNFSSGFVGIGTTTPSNMLDVRGVINASGMIYYNNGTAVTSSGGNVSGGGTAGYIPQWTGTSTLNNSPIYTSGGKVGIGTGISPPSTLSILAENTIGTGLALYTSDYLLGESGAALGMFFGASTGETYSVINAYTLAGLGNLIFNSGGGNVGIGTTSPISALHVNGTAGGFTVDVAGSMPTLNTTMSKNMTITSSGGSVIIQLG